LAEAIDFESEHWDRPLDKPIWYWRRNYYLAVWGEYESCDSWSADKVVRKSTRELNRLFWSYNQIPPLDVVLNVSISGKRGKGGRLRPWRWNANLSFGSYRTNHFQWRGSCKSVADALRKAGAVPDLQEQADELIRKAYSIDPGTKSVYVKKGDEWIPFCTDYGISYAANKQWPTGQYAIVRWEKPHNSDVWRRSLVHLKNHGSWYNSGGFWPKETTPDLAPWTEHPETQEKNVTG
jgi:hypothetical protein